MGCGCKKKVQVLPEKNPAKIVLTENGTPPRPPAPIQTPTQEPADLVKKLNEILSK